jgi:hypothetical protein
MRSAQNAASVTRSQAWRPLRSTWPAVLSADLALGLSLPEALSGAPRACISRISSAAPAPRTPRCADAAVAPGALQAWGGPARTAVRRVLCDGDHVRPVAVRAVEQALHAAAHGLRVADAGAHRRVRREVRLRARAPRDRRASFHAGVGAPCLLALVSRASGGAAGRACMAAAASATRGAARTAASTASGTGRCGDATWSSSSSSPSSSSATASGSPALLKCIRACVRAPERRAHLLPQSTLKRLI